MRDQLTQLMLVLKVLVKSRLLVEKVPVAQVHQVGNHERSILLS